MTNSEKLLSSFSENYFYKELVYVDLKFTPIGGTEIELADLIMFIVKYKCRKLQTKNVGRCNYIL